MRVDVAGALWRKVASVPLTWYLAIAAAALLVALLRWLSRSRRRRGSIRPIGYFSYITHSAVPSVCATCGVEVPERTKKLCLSNPRRFRGMVYCDRHRRVRPGARGRRAGALLRP